jgi:hypothetical protein
VRIVATLSLLCLVGCSSQTEQPAESAALTTHSHIANRCRAGCARPIQAAPLSVQDRVDAAVRLFAPATAIDVTGYHIDADADVLVDVSVGVGPNQAYAICNEVKRSIALDQILLSASVDVAIPGDIQALASC